MERDNILQFPSPDHGLSSEALTTEITRLSGELASAVSDVEEFGDYAAHLARIERASILLENISRLLSGGRDRICAVEAFERVMRSIAELRSRSGKEEAL